MRKTTSGSGTHTEGDLRDALKLPSSSLWERTQRLLPPKGKRQAVNPKMSGVDRTPSRSSTKELRTECLAAVAFVCLWLSHIGRRSAAGVAQALPALASPNTATTRGPFSLPGRSTAMVRAKEVFRVWFFFILNFLRG
ncbi:hypothetical protein HGM15179_000409 [Zosterops borbonicus]|uniref:Uncharacterized protein n=1 Tax=Zosterops borbonicus TaxID=364589 RepID=A0A8K1GYD0_9PASS|nr:hypothetical protein HGM15179_000409 [Zosterops borbonicus]